MPCESKNGLCSEESKKQENETGKNGKIDALPQDLANAVISPPPGILGNEHTRVTTDATEKDHEQEGI